MLPVIENRSLIPVILLYSVDIMSTTTALDFQAVITQNEGNKKLLENTSIILYKEVMTRRKRPAASADFAQVSGLS